MLFVMQPSKTILGVLLKHTLSCRAQLGCFDCFHQASKMHQQNMLDQIRSSEDGMFLWKGLPCTDVSCKVVIFFWVGIAALTPT